MPAPAHCREVRDIRFSGAGLKAGPDRRSSLWPCGHAAKPLVDDCCRQRRPVGAVPDAAPKKAGGTPKRPARQLLQTFFVSWP